MKETPIIFAPESVRATVERRKTQTRRVLEPQPPEDTISIYPAFPKEKNSPWFDCLRDATAAVSRFKSKFGGVGDLLWVKEGIYQDGTGFFRYAADDSTVFKTHPAEKLRLVYTARFMPRWACRLELIITALRFERVQEIKYPEDIRSEGFLWRDPFYSEHSAKKEFAEKWNEINGKREGGQFSWEANPWVIVIEYDIHSLKQ